MKKTYSFSIRAFSLLHTCLLVGCITLLCACRNVSDTQVVNPLMPLKGDSDLMYIIRQGDNDVVVLPNIPRQQGLVTLGVEDNKLLFAFEQNGARRLGEYEVYAFLNNTLLPSTSIITNAADTTAALILPKAKKGRSFLRIYAQSGNILFNDLLIPLQDGRPVTDTKYLTRHDDQAQVLYSILIDRFNNGNTSNDWKMNSPEVLDIVDYQGGDLAGITQKIQEGFFDDLGINTLWISPITQNPYDAWGRYDFKNKPNKYTPEQPYTKFSAYHGYWPIYTTVIDRRLGTDKELKELLSVAHEHHINVILDYVANHLHINSPVYQQHPDWHTDSILPDGRRNFELWDEARLTTWFDTHIPTLDLERAEVREAMVDSAMFWLKTYDLDGFRHDACKHIPTEYWQLLAQKIQTELPNRHIWAIGETYGSPELIGSYVASDMLNAQFDFNVYFTAIDVLCNDRPMSNLARVIEESLAAYGAHHSMGNISGNHDQIRFASLAGGAIHSYDDGKEEGWTRDVTIGDSAVAYKKALLLQVLNMTIPGVPCIYQGDEYAEVGGGDPDNRHLMRWDNELNDAEQAYKTAVKDLIRLRRTSMPLLYGDYQLLAATDDVLSFERVYLGQRIQVTIDKANLTYKIEQK